MSIGRVKFYCQLVLESAVKEQTFNYCCSSVGASIEFHPQELNDTSIHTAQSNQQKSGNAAFTQTLAASYTIFGTRGALYEFHIGSSRITPSTHGNLVLVPAHLLLEVICHSFGWANELVSLVL